VLKLLQSIINVWEAMTMNKRLWVALAAVVILLVGGLVWWKSTQSSELDYDAIQLDGQKLLSKQAIIDAVAKTGNGQEPDQDIIIPDHYVGNKDASVIVIEYEDFACSHCQSFYPYTKKIHDDYKDKVLFIYRDFSLGYPNSTATIGAAEAAYLVGGETAFWQMYDLLFQDTKWVGQAVPTDERKTIFDSYAGQIGLDVAKFNQALLNTSVNGIKDKIDRDKSLGTAAGATGTPTWIVDGEKVDSTDEKIRQAIDKALSAAD
jgi:protein-disulfide isomerase